MKTIDIIKQEYDLVKDEITLEQDCSYMHLMECICLYDFVLQYCLKNNIKSITDIGTAHSIQGSIFNSYDIEYNAINDIPFDKQSKITKYHSYQYATYGKDRVITDKNSLAVAVLSLGWPCFVDTEQADEQYRKLSKDFNAALLYVPLDNLELIQKHFNKVDIIDKFIFATN